MFESIFWVAVTAVVLWGLAVAVLAVAKLVYSFANAWGARRPVFLAGGWRR